MTPPDLPDPAHAPPCNGGVLGHADPGAELVNANGRGGTPVLTICIPAYRHTAAKMIADLGRLQGASSVALVVYDDGSGDPAIDAVHAGAIHAFPGPARLVISPVNRGRSHARNRLVALATTDWVLLLDADMLPDDDQFLSRYLAAIAEAIGPELIAGGFSLKHVNPRPEQRLHAAQSRHSDCLPAAARNRAPGRYVFTSNILVHRAILDTVAFDEGFTGWGWEDVDWGLRVADGFPVRHIDNTATHTGLEPDSRLFEKFGSSGHNFARLAAKHPEAAAAMPLMRAARRVKSVPFVRPIAHAIAASRLMPDRVRVFALKLYRAAAYAKHIAPR